MRKDTDGFIQYRCSQCEQQPYLLKALGHDGPPENYYDKNAVTGELLKECPVMTLIKGPPDVVTEMMRMERDDFPLFTAGFLKVAGGIANQPNRWLAWMREINATKHAVQAAYERANVNEG